MQSQILYNSTFYQLTDSGPLAAFLSPPRVSSPQKLFNTNIFANLIPTTMSDQEQAAGKRKRASKYLICFLYSSPLLYSNLVLFAFFLLFSFSPQLHGRLESQIQTSILPSILIWSV